MKRAAALATFALLCLAATVSAEEPKPVLGAYFSTGFADADWQKAAYTKVAGTWKASRPLPERGKKAVVISTVARGGLIASDTCGSNAKDITGACP